MSQWNRKYIRIFHGWNADTSPGLLPEEQFSVFQNVDMEERTRLKSRSGTFTIHEDSTPDTVFDQQDAYDASYPEIQGLYHDNARTVQRLWIVVNGDMYYYDGGTGDNGFNYNTHGLYQRDCFDVDENVEFLRYGENLFVISPSRGLRILRGSGFASIGNSPAFPPPKGGWLMEWNGRMFTAEPGSRRLRWNDDLGFYTTWTDFQDFPSNIIGGVVLEGYPFIFCEDGVYQIEYDPIHTYNYQPTFCKEAPVSYRSIAAGDNRLYFTATDGVYVFDGNREVRLSAGRLDNWFMKRNKPVMHKAAGFYRNGCYYCSIPGQEKIKADLDGDTENVMVVYDEVLNRFGLNTGPFAATRSWAVNTEAGQVWQGGRDGMVYKAFLGTTDAYAEITTHELVVGGDISFKKDSIKFKVQKQLDCGFPYHHKHFWAVVANVEKTGNQNLQVGYGPTQTLTSNNISVVSANRWGTGVWGTMTWGDEARTRKEIPVASGYNTGDFFNIRLQATSSVSQTIIHEFGIDFKRPSGRR